MAEAYARDVFRLEGLVSLVRAHAFGAGGAAEDGDPEGRPMDQERLDQWTQEWAQQQQQQKQQKLSASAEAGCFTVSIWDALADAREVLSAWTNDVLDGAGGGASANDKSDDDLDDASPVPLATTAPAIAAATEATAAATAAATTAATAAAAAVASEAAEAEWTRRAGRRDGGTARELLASQQAAVAAAKGQLVEALALPHLVAKHAARRGASYRAGREPTEPLGGDGSIVDKSIVDGSDDGFLDALADELMGLLHLSPHQIAALADDEDDEGYDVEAEATGGGVLAGDWHGSSSSSSSSSSGDLVLQVAALAKCLEVLQQPAWVDAPVMEGVGCAWAALLTHAQQHAFYAWLRANTGPISVLDLHRSNGSSGSGDSFPCFNFSDSGHGGGDGDGNATMGRGTKEKAGQPRSRSDGALQHLVNG